MRRLEEYFRPAKPSEPTLKSETSEALEIFLKYAREKSAIASQKIQEAIEESNRYLAEAFGVPSIDSSDESIQNALHAGDAEVGLLESINAKQSRYLPWLSGLALIGQIERMAQPDVKPDFESRDVASEQLENTGITDERRSAYIPGVSEALYRAIPPFTYHENLIGLISSIPLNLTEGREEMWITPSYYPDQTFHLKKSDHLDKEDAWRLYLGLPQENDTFSISSYQPEKSTEDVYYYKIDGWIDSFAVDPGRDQKIEHPPNPIERIIKALKEASGEEWELDELGVRCERVDGFGYVTKGNGDTLIADDLRLTGDNANNGVMGQFLLSKGHDEQGYYISYYDRWDLGATIEGEEGLFGKPFEIYDRIYYDPITFEVIPQK